LNEFIFPNPNNDYGMKLCARARQAVAMPIMPTPDSMVLLSSEPLPSSVRRVVKDMQVTNLFPDQMQVSYSRTFSDCAFPNLLRSEAFIKNL